MFYIRQIVHMSGCSSKIMFRRNQVISAGSKWIMALRAVVQHNGVPDEVRAMYHVDSRQMVVAFLKDMCSINQLSHAAGIPVVCLCAKHVSEHAANGHEARQRMAQVQFCQRRFQSLGRFLCSLPGVDAEQTSGSCT